MSFPFFSIIVPTYNSVNYINRCIESLLSQNFKNFEILIIDGLSNDDTIAKIKTYDDDRIKIITEADEGIYDAMNKGIALATGKWLLFLGSDDELYDNNVLNEIFVVADNATNKVIYGNVILLGDTGWGHKGQTYDGEFTLDKLLNKNIAHQSIFYHKQVFDKCGYYDKRFKICADYDFNLRAAATFKFKYLDKTIAKFNAGGASTNSQDEEFKKLYILNVINYFKLQLFQIDFEQLAPLFKRQLKQDFKSFKIFRGAFLSLIVLYYKIRRHL